MSRSLLALPIATVLVALTCGHAQACDYPTGIVEGFTPTRRTIPADGIEDLRVRVSNVLVSDRDPFQWFGIRGVIVAADEPSVMTRRIEVRGHWNARCFAPTRGYDIGPNRQLTGWVVGQFVDASEAGSPVMLFTSETQHVQSVPKDLRWRRLRWTEAQ